MQSPEETFFGERISTTMVPLHVARHNREWDGAARRSARFRAAEVTDVNLSKNRTFCCGAGGGFMWKEEE